MAFSTEVLADSPLCYWQHRSSGSINETDASGNGNTLVYTVSGVTVQQASVTGDASDYSVDLDGAAGYGVATTPASYKSATAVTLEWVGIISSTAGTGEVLICAQPENRDVAGSSNSGAGLLIETTGLVTAYCCQGAGDSYAKVAVSHATDLRDDTAHHIALTADGSNLRLYIDGTESISASMGSIDLSEGNADRIYVGAGLLQWSPFEIPGFHNEANVCETAVYTSALSASRIATHASEAGLGSPPATPASSIPLTLKGFETYAASSIPLTLKNRIQHAAASLPLNLEGSDSTHYLADVARWTLGVTLDGADISDQVAGPCEVDHQEDASGLCSLLLSPGTGAILPAAYERKPLLVSFVGADSAGAELYRLRLFTGTTTAAVYDPDAGTMEVDATTDLQGSLENWTWDVIAAEIGGSWSPHVFDESADGYQHALDRLSTLASEMHMDNYGRFTVTPYAAKGTPDITLTDAGRFNNTLQLNRANRRDLISRMRLNFDFRFTRLRHREISVRFSGPGFCHYLEWGYSTPSKNMVTQAADSSAWTRTSDITFEELPGPGTYCTPSRGWVGGAEEFCLGANWTAARRWAQTVTEEYSIDVIASDLEESIGVQMINADYGVEATYDAGDYERLTDFTGPPSGSVLATETEDYQLDADTATYDGRTAMETAQTCAIAMARSQILKRARGTRVEVGALFRPDITLEKTVRINTPHLDATGKVARVRHILDPTTGVLDTRVTIALSRHDGSGLASDDPVTAPAAPSQPVETPTDRNYVIGYRIGGLAGVPADSDDFDGHMSNVNPNLQTSTTLYRERFALRMPEIEAAARSASVVLQSQEYEVAVPDDPLTMSN